MATRIGGRLHWLWRAVDEHGQTLDVLLQEHRDTVAAERITTDKLGSYAATIVQVPEMQSVEHVQVRSAMRCSQYEQAGHATVMR